MYKQCRTEQSAQRQRQLERGLLNAMLKQQYDEISVSDLCDELGIPRKSFYRYFSSKDGALHALIDHTLLDYDSFSVAESVVEKQTAIRFMERMFSYWIQCKPLLDALAKSGLSGELIQRAIEYSKQQSNIPLFLITQDKQVQEYGTMFAVCGLMSMLVQWHHDGFSQSVEQMALLAVRLLSQPLFPNVIVEK